MTYITKQITGYRVVCRPADPNMIAAIEIYCEDDCRMTLYFLEGPLPDWAINDFDRTNIEGVAYLSGSNRYPHYIDLLRNEGPLTLYIYPDEVPPNFAICTAEEGIGEGEIAGTLDRIRGLLARKPLAAP